MNEAGAGWVSSNQFSCDRVHIARLDGCCAWLRFLPSFCV